MKGGHYKRLRTSTNRRARRVVTARLTIRNGFPPGSVRVLPMVARDIFPNKGELYEVTYRFEVGRAAANGASKEAGMGAAAVMAEATKAAAKVIKGGRS